jgi:hypothetical protein
MSDLKYKYQKQINSYSLTDCPPKDSISAKGEAYRWVNDPITADDFKPHIVLGMLPRGTEPFHLTCMRCGLSMFTTLDSAKSKYKTLPKKSHFKYTHVAKGELLKEDGMSTKENKENHFTLHEFEGISLEEKFTIADKL